MDSLIRVVVSRTSTSTRVTPPDVPARVRQRLLHQARRGPAELRPHRLGKIDVRARRQTRSPHRPMSAFRSAARSVVALAAALPCCVPANPRNASNALVPPAMIPGSMATAALWVPFGTTSAACACTSACGNVVGDHVMQLRCHVRGVLRAAPVLAQGCQDHHAFAIARAQQQSRCHRHDAHQHADHRGFAAQVERAPSAPAPRGGRTLRSRPL